MSFFDTLKQYGLWPQQQQGQPQQQPYGLDPEMVRQARMQSLSNLGGQILAASMKQTDAQRANLMSNMDWTGGYNTNLYNAAQMKLMGDKQRQSAQDDDRAKAARLYVAQTLQGMPDGPERRKAIAYLQLGDLPKAIETVYGGGDQSALQERVNMLVQSGVDRNTAIGIATGRFHVTTDPFTNTQRITDLAGNPVPQPSQGGAPLPATSAAPASAGTPAPVPPPASAPTGGATLTPAQLSQGTEGIDARKTAEKAVVERNAGLRTNAEGAIGFLRKIKKTETTLGGMTDTDFGPLQGERDSPYVGTVNTVTKAATDWLTGDNSLARQDAYRRDLADLELDVAKMKLKGDGPITDAERGIARQTVGGLTVADKETAERALKAQKIEAAEKIRDAVQQGLLRIEDLAAAGINPAEVEALLQEAAGVAPGAAPSAPSTTSNIKIRQIK